MCHNGGSLYAEIPGLAPMPAVPQDLAVDLNMSREDIMVTEMNLSQLYDGQLELQQGVPASNNPNDAYALHPQDSSMTGIVAGPLPTCFGAAGLDTSGSALTEFTKRRNWSQRVLQELRDFLHILTPHGCILYASASCKALTGWEPQQLLGRLIGDFIHPDHSGIFVKEFDESIASGNPLRLLSLPEDG
ncbi:cutinase palindrome-binding protein [Paraphaeosphaeria sporulosa]